MSTKAKASRSAADQEDATDAGHAGTGSSRYRQRYAKLFYRRTHPLIWLLAVVCTVLAIIVIIAGVVVFAGYLILKPRLPYIYVSYAHLDSLNYDQDGRFESRLTIHLTAVNDNAKVHATFTDLGLQLGLNGLTLASLVSDPFDVERNSSLTLQYAVGTSEVMLSRAELEELVAEVKSNKIGFVIKGDARTVWKVGLIGYVKFWTHLSCRVDFSTNGNVADASDCSSKSR